MSPVLALYLLVIVAFYFVNKNIRELQEKVYILEEKVKKYENN